MVSFRVGWSVAIGVFCAFLVVADLLANDEAENDEAVTDQSFEVMRDFVEQETVQSEFRHITEQRKHQIMFVMGTILLITIITAASLGIAMVLFGKQVFVAHMVFAGFSVFLAIAHAVTAVVWFFPF